MPVGTAFFDKFLARLQSWTDDMDLSTDLMVSWIEMAEERFNNELRCLEMVSTRRVFFDDQCTPMPDDFLSMISVRYTGSGLPLRYVSPDEYYRLRSATEFYLSGPQTTSITYLDPQTGAPLGPLPRQPAFIDYPGRAGPELPLARNVYSYLGNVLYVHPTVTPPGDPNPTEVELTYYAKVPPLAEAQAPTPLYVRAPKLYTYATLAHSAPYLIEDQRITIWDGTTTAQIKTMNEAAMTGRVVSSPVVVQIRSFG